jgi:hypothetical protein
LKILELVKMSKITWYTYLHQNSEHNYHIMKETYHEENMIEYTIEVKNSDVNIKDIYP